MTDLTQGQSDAIRAVTFGFYSLVAVLEAKGLHGLGAEVAGQMRQFRDDENPDLVGTLEAVASNLEDNPFGPLGSLRLSVIDGGKSDSAERLGRGRR